MWGFIFRKGKSSLLHYLKCLRETKFCLGMNKAVSDLRRTSVKTVGEVPGEAGNSSGAAAAQCCFTGATGAALPAWAKLTIF